jgi:hypothetical protein
MSTEGFYRRVIALWATIGVWHTLTGARGGVDRPRQRDCCGGYLISNATSRLAV